MCGIIGKVSKDNFNLSPSLKLLTHRGPDASSQESFHVEDCIFKMGHTRLSIIDLDDRSNQPFNYLNKYFLVFNGEIYNYKELRNRLQEYQFTTESDTEVLLYWLIKYNGDKLNELNGIFSFCFYNVESGELLLGRDQLGIKPLYYIHNKNEFVFSSEIKAILELSSSEISIKNESIAEFLQLGFLMEPSTGFNEILKIPPGNLLILNISENVSELKEYWNPLLEINSKEDNHKVKDIGKFLEKSIQNQLVSDVPVGTFFSGGVDSSIIAANVPKENVFLTSVNESKDVSEAGIENDQYYAEQISSRLGIKLTKIRLLEDNDNLFEKLKIVVDINEELISDFTSYPTYILSKKAKEMGLSVMLSGMGADEIFGGYPRYIFMKYSKIIRKSYPIFKAFRKHPFFQKKIERIKGFVQSRDYLESYLNLLTPFTQENIKNLSGTNLSNESFKGNFSNIWCEYENLGPVKAAMCFDIYGFLSHNFILADKASMKASVEMRVPLATKELLKFSLNSKNKILLRGWKTKILLKKYLLNFLPKDLIFRRKSGFHPPLDNKINQIGHDVLVEFFKNSTIKKRLNLIEIENILYQHFYLEKNNTFKIYRLMYLSTWLDYYE